MWIFATRLVDSTSAHEKFYHVILTPGYIIKHWGGRKNAGSGPTLATIGTVRVESVPEKEIYSRQAVRRLASQHDQLVADKHSGTRSSSQYDFDIKAALLEVDIEPIPLLSGPNDRDVFARKVIRAFLGHQKRHTSPATTLTWEQKVVAEAGSPRGASTVSTNKRQARAAEQEKKKNFRTRGSVTRPNGEKYLPRRVGDHHDVALLQHLHQSGIFVRVYGPPGTGKSALVEAAFPNALTINGHGDMTVSHFVGTLLPTSNGGWTWADSPLTRAMKEGRMLFVDEITRIPTEVLAILYSVMDGRGVLRLDDRPDLEPIVAQKGFGVIAGYNPDTLGARALDEALISRFRIGIEVTTDYKAAASLGVPDKAITLAKNLQERNEKDRKNGGPGLWVPQMRELLTYRDLINAEVGERFAVEALAASCPREADLDIVRSTASKVFGYSVDVPRLGASI